MPPTGVETVIPSGCAVTVTLMPAASAVTSRSSTAAGSRVQSHVGRLTSVASPDEARCGFHSSSGFLRSITS